MPDRGVICSACGTAITDQVYQVQRRILTRDGLGRITKAETQKGSDDFCAPCYQEAKRAEQV